MFSEIIPIKKDKGKGERLKAYNTKEVYFICKYNGALDGITFKDFIKDFPKYVQIAEFQWEHKGYPNYDTATRWYTKYEWKKDYKIYENFMNGTAQSDLLIDYIKNLRSSGASLLQIKKNLIKALETGSKLPFLELLRRVYMLAKLGELITMVDNLLQEDILFNNTEDEESKLVPIDNNPAWEDDEFLEERREMLWKLVNKRGGD
ncbi:MAG: hypothetical protein IJ743_00485 [Bacilli bacterium]|nr:hypothetical protein [Bacilli bacterium]